MTFFLGITIYAIIEFVVLGFMVSGSVLEMFKATEQDPQGEIGCLSLWGERAKCSSVSIKPALENLFVLCPKMNDLFKVSLAFAILSVMIMVTCFVLALFLYCCCYTCGCFMRSLVLLLTFIGSSSAAVVWICMTCAYYNSYGGCTPLKETNKLGLGFIFVTVAFGLNCINIFMVLLM